MEFYICAILLFIMCYGFWKYERMKEAEAQEEQYVQEIDMQDVKNKTMEETLLLVMMNILVIWQLEHRFLS